MKTEEYLERDYQYFQKEAYIKKMISTPGIWIDGKVYWIHNGYEKLIPEHSLSVHIKHVQKHSKIQYSEIFVRNHSSVKKECKLFMLNHYPKAYTEHVSFVSPTDNVIFHSIDGHLMLINGEVQGASLDQRTIQPIWNVHADLIWSNYRAGILKYQPMGKGSSVSIYSLNMKINSQKTAVSRNWTIYGEDKKELMELNTILFKTSTSIS